MKNTNARMEAVVPFPIVPNWKPSPNEKVHVKLEFDLVFEDWEAFEESREYMNDHMQTDDDRGDHMLALITYAIHQAYEMRTGKKWTLRMDRKGN